MPKRFILFFFVYQQGNIIKGDLGIALPLVIFGGLSVGAGLLVLFLPETTNKVLPDTVEDAKNFGRLIDSCFSRKIMV